MNKRITPNLKPSFGRSDTNKEGRIIAKSAKGLRLTQRMRRGQRPWRSLRILGGLCVKFFFLRPCGSIKRAAEKTFPPPPEEETGNEAPLGNRVSEKTPLMASMAYTYKIHKYTRNISPKKINVKRKSKKAEKMGRKTVIFPNKLYSWRWE
jgi:hypothetical protein